MNLKLAKTLITIAAIGALISPFAPVVKNNHVAVQATVVHAQGVNDILTGKDLPGCFSGVSGCIVSILYYIFYVPTALFAYIGGAFLDFFVHFSLDHFSYRSDFVESGWKLTRDISNLFFIIILIYTALMTVLDLSSNTKHVIVNVVIIALLINFSLFMSKVIIDSSNILGRIFYDAVVIKDANGTVVAESQSGEKSISRALLSQINPQKLMNPDSLANAAGESNHNNLYIVIILIASIVNVVLVYVFLSIGFLFLWRVIGLWLAMIFSPLAFITHILPGGGKILGDMSWDKWLSNLVNLAFMAPIFAFFLYLILKFAQIGTSTLLPNYGTIDQSTLMGFFRSIVFVILPLAFITALLLKAKKLTTDLAGEGGKAFATAGAAIAGLAAGAVTGGYAALGRGTIGRMGSAVAESSFLKRNAAKSGLGGWTARRTMELSRGAQNATFDARGIPNVGIPTEVGKPKGGFKKVREMEVEKELKYASSLEVGEDEKLKQDLYKAKAEEEKAKAEGKTGDDLKDFTKAVKDAESAIKKENQTRRNNYAGVVAAQSAPVEMLKGAAWGAVKGATLGTVIAPGVGTVAGALAGAGAGLGAEHRADYSGGGGKEAANKIRTNSKAPKRDKEGNKVDEKKDDSQNDLLKKILEELQKPRP